MDHPPKSPDGLLMFDLPAVALHRRRAVARYGEHDFLAREVGTRLVERLDDTKRDFPLAAAFGWHGPVLESALGNRGGVERLIRCGADPVSPGTGVLSEAEALPFAAGSIDLALSLLDWHWINDLPGLLVQIRRALRPDGLLLGAMLGGDTLHELRGALLQAEEEVEGGISPRVSAFADVADLGGLLQRAGFALPVVDVDTITVTYADAFALMRDLRGMGEANAMAGRRRAFSRRETLLRAAALYSEQHGQADGRIPATFQVLYMTAWCPHPEQPKPAKRGSARQSLASALSDEA